MIDPIPNIPRTGDLHVLHRHQDFTTMFKLAAFGPTRLMSSLLYAVKAYDPTTFLSVTLLLIGTAMLACAGPALRASLVNPVLALRSE